MRKVLLRLPIRELELERPGRWVRIGNTYRGYISSNPYEYLLKYRKETKK